MPERSLDAHVMAILIFKLMISISSWGYPNFIGYGYTTCTTCHYNTQGNGPLTDYGRALFAQEIAARPFIPRQIDDEKLAEYSGFIPGYQLPYWIRPSIKTRALWYERSPGSSQAIKKWLVMQRDFNLTFIFDEAAQNIMTFSFGFLPEEKNYYKDDKATQIVSREHYIRVFLTKSLSLAVGLFDKVYGIRTADHTSANRVQIGFGQDDQVHGAQLEYTGESSTTSLHLFAGNTLKPKDQQTPGWSTLFEYDLFENNRAGFSMASFLKGEAHYQRFAIHDRWGIPEAPGTSLLTELGVKNDQSTPSTKTRMGIYGFAESTVLLTRGYFFLTAIEKMQQEIKPSSLDIQKWTLGFLTFPLPRTEVRMTYSRSKSFSSESIAKDQDDVQAQLHFSL